MLYNGDGLFIAGLTGMSGAGKSTASRIFREKGYCIIDCDKVSREVTEKGMPALKKIAQHFGHEALNADGTFNRRYVGNIVFSDRKQLNALQNIIFPFILYRVHEMICEGAENGFGKFLVDAPTLFESGADKFCDSIVSVTADAETCIKRIMARDNLNLEQARDRLSSMHGEEFYRENSSFSISNNGSEDEFISAVSDIADKMGDNGL